MIDQCEDVPLRCVGPCCRFKMQGPLERALFELRAQCRVPVPQCIGRRCFRSRGVLVGRRTGRFGHGGRAGQADTSDDRDGKRYPCTEALTPNAFDQCHDLLRLSGEFMRGV